MFVKLKSLIIVFALGFVMLNASSLKLGVFPYTDPIQVIKSYNDLREYISKEMGVEVEIYTANSFLQYFQNTQANMYDIVVTPPHFGVLHVKKGFVPLYRYDRFLSPIFVVRSDSSIDGVADFKDKKVALSSYLSISSISGLVEIEMAKININQRDILNTPTHQAAVTSVIFGESDIAITTHTPLNMMSKNIDMSKIKVIDGNIKVPHVFTLASPKLDKQTIKKLQTVLKNYEQTPGGKTFFSTTGFQGYTDITKDDIKILEPFIGQTEQYLK